MQNIRDILGHKTFIFDILISGSFLKYLFVVIFTSTLMFSVSAQNLPTTEDLIATRAKAHQDRFKTYVLKKLEVHSIVQKNRGMCLDFMGGSDGLYKSMFDSGPLMVDLANCGEENDLIDGRIRAIRILDPAEKQDGLSDEQVDQVIDEINALFSNEIYDPQIGQ